MIFSNALFLCQSQVVNKYCELYFLQGLERRPDPQVPDGKWSAGEAPHPHRSHSIPGVQECRGLLCVQGQQDLKSAQR